MECCFFTRCNEWHWAHGVNHYCIHHPTVVADAGDSFEAHHRPQPEFRVSNWGATRSVLCAGRAGATLGAASMVMRSTWRLRATWSIEYAPWDGLAGIIVVAALAKGDGSGGPDA